MKPLIAVHSCQSDIRNGRNQAIRETWGAEVLQYADLKFFVGGVPCLLQRDEVWVDACDGKYNLIEKEAAMLRWCCEQGYERILKTETDVYIVADRMFQTNFSSCDAIGSLVGEKIGRLYGSSNVYSFFQGHAIWYSKKAAQFVADALLDTFARLSPSVTFSHVCEIDPGARSADLWSMQALIPKWKDGLITMREESGFGRGPLTYHIAVQNPKPHVPERLRELHQRKCAGQFP
jgi:hypothetical protein